jgi:hypothetical protein
LRTYLAKGKEEDCTVFFRGGEYTLDSTWYITENDVKQNDHKMTFAAYANEKPVISGGKKVTGWKPCDTLQNIWYTEIPDLCTDRLVQSEQCKWFSQLYKNGRRIQRARFPESNTFLIIDSVFKPSKALWFHSDLFPQKLTHYNDIDLNIFHSWDISKETIDTIINNKIITRDYIGVDDAGGYLRPKKGSLFYLENAYEFIDCEDEWCLDRSTKRLYYKAKTNENPNDSEFIIPSLFELLTIKGTDTSAIRNIVFKGLTFSYSRWEIRPDIGFDGGQFGHYYNQLADNPEYRKLLIPAAITVSHTQNCVFEKCTFEHIGQVGIAVAERCDSIKIKSCKINDIGSTGIMVGWRGNLHSDGLLQATDEDWKNSEDAPKNVVISKNTISNCGREFPSSCGIHVLFSQNTVISSNVITDMPDVGIGIGFSWNKSPTSLKNTIVESNTLKNCFQVLADGGAIYTLGNQQSLVIRNNTIEDIKGSEVTSRKDAVIAGIFFDDGSANIKAYSNTFKNCRDKNYHTNIHLVGTQLLSPGPIEIKK